MIHVMFVCTGNICRSPMAEYYLKHLTVQHHMNSITSFSAGIFGCVDTPAADHALTVMNEIGIDLSGHLGKQLNDFLVSQADFRTGINDF